MTLLTSFSFKVEPKMDFVRMCLVWHFTRRDTFDYTSFRNSRKDMPDSKETDWLAMETNLLPLQA